MTKLELIEKAIEDFDLKSTCNYKIVMNQMDDVLNGGTLPFMSDAPDLVNDILEAKSYPQFKKIQRHIKLGKYKNNL